METEHKPWEWMTVDNENGGYDLVRADEETRKRQLDEYKTNRIKELEEEIDRIKTIF